MQKRGGFSKTSEIRVYFFGLMVKFLLDK